MPDWSAWGVLPYVGVLIAAIVEGEIAYVAAAALVAQGHLSAVGVLVSGALGAAIGDQAYFYAFRGRLPRWLARFPRLHQRATPWVAPVRRHASLMVVLIRFAPGFRVAMTAACAWAEIPALKFSVLNTLSSLVWAVGVMALVVWIGPASFERMGLGPLLSVLATGIVVVALLNFIGYCQRWHVRRQRPA